MMTSLTFPQSAIVGAVNWDGCDGLPEAERAEEWEGTATAAAKKEGLQLRMVLL